MAKRPLIDLQSQCLSHQSRSMGIYICAGKGSGKSRLMGRGIAAQDFLAGIPQVILDPLGTTIDNFLDRFVRFLCHVPVELHPAIWQRIVYVDMSGKGGSVVPFPLYYWQGNERGLRDVAERYLSVIRKSDPALLSASIEGWNPLHRLGVYTGMVLVALNYQITEAEELIRRPEAWTARFAKAVARHPDVLPAVEFFTNEYLPLPEAGRRRLQTAFLDKIFLFGVDPHLRAMFGAPKPGIVWEDVIRKRQTVLLDFRSETDAELRRFKLIWAFTYLYEYIKLRGRSSQPLGVIIDELTALVPFVASGRNPLAVELDEFMNQYMRQHTIWLTVAHQELFQLDMHMQKTLRSLGTHLIGHTDDMEAALTLAREYMPIDPLKAKRYENVWGSEEIVTDMGQASRREYFVLEQKPVEYSVDEQLDMAARRIKRLGLFEFLLKPALGEGQVSTELLPLTIAPLDFDRTTGRHIWPDLDVVARVRAQLAKHTGMSIPTLCAAIAARTNPQPQATDTHAPLLDNTSTTPPPASGTKVQRRKRLP